MWMLLTRSNGRRACTGTWICQPLLGNLSLLHVQAGSWRYIVAAASCQAVSCSWMRIHFVADHLSCKHQPARHTEASWLPQCCLQACRVPLLTHAAFNVFTVGLLHSCSLASWWHVCPGACCKMPVLAKSALATLLTPLITGHPACKLLVSFVLPSGCRCTAATAHKQQQFG
jgi:hypothetical protein